MDEATELWALLNDSSLSSSPSSLSPSWFFEMLRNQTALEMLSNYTNDFDFNGTSLAYPKSIILSSIASETSTSTSISTTKTTTITSTGKNQQKNEFYSDLFTIAVYSLIILVSLCGNSLVLRMILVRKKMQTTTNILIVWLAVSDLLTTTLNIPFNVARFLSMNYPFPSFFCKLVPFIQVMCVYVSTLTMGVIAFHRYLTVTSSTRSISITKSSSTKMVRPLLLHGSICFCAIMTSVWFFAGLLATPHSMFNQIALVPYQNKTYVRCRAEYPKMDFNFRFVLSLEAFLTQYMIPLGLICFLYIRIGSVVAKQGRVAQKATSHRRMKQESARRRRLTMLILVVLVFGICWLPLNLYHLLVDFHLIKSNFTTFLFCHWIAMSSVCWNPFIYCWLNESFRNGATRMILFLCCWCCPQIRQKLMILRRSSQADSDNPILTPNIGGGGGGGGGISTANATILIESNDNVQRSNQTDPNTIKDKDRTKMDLNEKEHQSVNDETKQSFMEKSRHIVDDVGDNNNDDDDDDDDDDAMIKASSNDIRLKNSQAIPNESNNRSASDKDDIGFEMNIVDDFGEKYSNKCIVADNDVVSNRKTEEKGIAILDRIPPIDSMNRLDRYEENSSDNHNSSSITLSSSLMSLTIRSRTVTTTNTTKTLKTMLKTSPEMNFDEININHHERNGSISSGNNRFVGDDSQRKFSTTITSCLLNPLISDSPTSTSNSDSYTTTSIIIYNGNNNNNNNSSNNSNNNTDRSNDDNSSLSFSKINDCVDEIVIELNPNEINADQLECRDDDDDDDEADNIRCCRAKSFQKNSRKFHKLRSIPFRCHHHQYHQHHHHHHHNHNQNDNDNNYSVKNNSKIINYDDNNLNRIYHHNNHHHNHNQSHSHHQQQHHHQHHHDHHHDHHLNRISENGKQNFDKNRLFNNWLNSINNRKNSQPECSEKISLFGLRFSFHNRLIRKKLRMDYNERSIITSFDRSKQASDMIRLDKNNSRNYDEINTNRIIEELINETASNETNLARDKSSNNSLAQNLIKSNRFSLERENYRNINKINRSNRKHLIDDQYDDDDDDENEDEDNDNKSDDFDSSTIETNQMIGNQNIITESKFWPTNIGGEKNGDSIKQKNHINNNNNNNTNNHNKNGNNQSNKFVSNSKIDWNNGDLVAMESNRFV